MGVPATTTRMQVKPPGRRLQNKRAKGGVMAQIFTSWNQLVSWLHQADRLRTAA
jgi:hypothetical protein